MSRPSDYTAIGPMNGEHDHMRCKCQRCLEAWLYYGNPPARPFKLRQRVTIISPHTKRIAHRGTVYRAYYDWSARSWVIGVKGEARRYVTWAAHVALDKRAAA